MNEMECKKMVLHFFRGAMIFLGIAALAVFVLDPFFHFHKPWFGRIEAQGMKEYQIPGAIEHMDYDSVLLGSSVVMSMNTDILEQRFDCKTIKAVGNSAPAPVLHYYLNAAMEHRNLKYVFYGLDVFSFYNDPDMEAISEEVQYLTNENPFDDVKYLWNGEIIAKVIPNMLKLLWKEDYSWGNAYSFNQYGECGPDLVLDNYYATLDSPWEYNEEAYVEENLSRLEAVVAEHPETEFLFFTPPYSVLWWIRSDHYGMLSSYENTLELCMERLLQYENVKMYTTGFNNEEIITDFYQYMDVVHGGTVVTERMAQELGDPEQEITLENYEEELAKLEQILNRFMDSFSTGP